MQMKITLKTARINKNYTQDEAAKLIGISSDTLSNYERGNTYPDVMTLKKIENIYGIEYKDIIFLTPNYE